MSILFKLLKKKSKPRRAIADVCRVVTENVKILIAVYVGSLMLAALLMMFIEGWRFFDGFWWSHVASLTIGFGDLAPKTDLGRMVAIVFETFWALYILLSLGAHVIQFLFRNRHEMTHEEQEWLFAGLVLIENKINAVALQNKALGDHYGVKLDMSAFINPDGSLIVIPPQPSDTSFGEVTHTDKKAITAPVKRT